MRVQKNKAFAYRGTIIINSVSPKFVLTFDTDGEFWTPLLHDRKTGSAIKSFHSSLFQMFYGVFLLRRKRRRRAQSPGVGRFFCCHRRLKDTHLIC